MTPADFVRTWSCAAAEVATQTGWAPKLVLATWALDTGWDSAPGMARCHTLLGIVPYANPCNGGQPFPATLCNESLCFQCFPDYFAFLCTFIDVTNGRLYDVVRAAGADPDAQAVALATRTGFAGGSASYLTGLRAVMAQIDTIGMTPCAPAPPPPVTLPQPFIGGTLTCDAGQTAIEYLINIRDNLPAYLIVSRNADFSTHDAVFGPFVQDAGVVFTPTAAGTWYAQLNRFAFLGNVVALTVTSLTCGAVTPTVCPPGTTGVWPNCVPVTPTTQPPPPEAGAPLLPGLLLAGGAGAAVYYAMRRRR